MRLADFILTNRESILADWEEFARTCAPASGGMDIAALRDHAGEMLTVIAADLKTPQNQHEQAQKSKGEDAPESGDPPTAAEKHGAERAGSGFSVEQMVSEYRALRASVMRLWTKSQGEITVADLEDVTRFNEAIDQSLAESVTRYTSDLDQSKEMFLAILGHDLRTPIAAVSTAAKFMLDTGDLKEPHATLASRIESSSSRMNRMVGDLLDFTRGRLGGGIPIARANVSMEKIVNDVVDEVSAIHPPRTIDGRVDGNRNGDWDCARISQVMTNIIGNALEHGSPGTVVSVNVGGDENDAVVAIHNRGPAIPPEQIHGIFNPMKNRETVGKAASGPTGSLGLGLYIADRIVSAHNGKIEVASSEERGTTFTVCLPRSAPSPA